MVKADKERVVNKFMELTGIDSVSFHERKMAALLKTELQELGFEVLEDDAAAALNGEAGNIYGILRGDPDKKPVLFSAHMDTVEPGIGKTPVLCDDGDTITSDGSTVLGADDVTGVVEILEGVRLAKDSAHGDIEVLFTMGEEAYAKGAGVFDYSRLVSEAAYVLDMSGAPGTAARKAPSIISFEVTVTGKSAHAGFAPEEGINALKTAANAIARIKQGHISENTTFNIGTIKAGKATNIIADRCVCTGEARGFDHEEAMAQIDNAEAIFREEAGETGAGVEISRTVHIKAYETPEDADVCRCFRRACAELGLKGEIASTLGGSDNNVFVQHGLSGIVLSSGMYNTHTTKEYTYAKDLITGSELVAAIIKNR
ncbi:MAG: M20/M25/M40 family metallo-hydrolase [Firmicutes bacterium]|nr:M20/M25/M40 family metallo-hydrolase [Bacillota bacterium]